MSWINEIDIIQECEQYHMRKDLYMGSFSRLQRIGRQFLELDCFLNPFQSMTWERSVRWEGEERWGT